MTSGVRALFRGSDDVSVWSVQALSTSISRTAKLAAIVDLNATLGKSLADRYRAEHYPEVAAALKADAAGV